MSMANQIKKLRQENNLTQEELADKLGLQKSAIAKYENGRVTNMKRSTIQKMAEIFGVSASYIMGFDNELKDKSVHCDYFVTDKDGNKIIIETIEATENTKYDSLLKVLSNESLLPRLLAYADGLIERYELEHINDIKEE